MLLRNSITTLTLLLASGHVLADNISTFVLEPTHTQVRFQWEHFGFSAPGANFNTVEGEIRDRKSTRLNSSHVSISYAVFCLKKKKITSTGQTTKPVTTITL